MGLLYKLVQTMCDRLACVEIPDPELDAIRLVNHVFNTSSADLLLDKDIKIGLSEKNTLEEYVSRRIAREPISKILGKKCFWNSSFIVGSNVLDPRPETEMLVEKVLNIALPNYRILDLGTGSGCIAISIALALSDCELIGSDISEQALKIAKKNSALHSVRVQFVKSDWFEDLEGLFDIVVCNPPYISDKILPSLSVEVRDYEPRIALSGDIDGLACYRKIASELANYLREDGHAFFEIGIGQLNAVKKIFTNEGFKFCGFWQDISGIDRVLCVKKDA